MAQCKLYVRYYGTEMRAGTFKNREAAEQFYNRNKDAFKQKDGRYGTPIYVEHGKGRSK